MENKELVKIDMVAASQDEDFIRCMQYLEMREIAKPMTKIVIAEKFGISDRTLRRWVERWDESGLLRKCRMAYMVPRVEEIRAAEDSVLDDWPMVLSNATKLAVGQGRSEKVAVEAMRFLHETVVAPRMDEKEDAGAAELKYVETIQGTARRFNPLEIEDASITVTKAKESE